MKEAIKDASELEIRRDACSMPFFGISVHVIVEGRNQTLFTLSTFEKSLKGRNFHCRASK